MTCHASADALPAAAAPLFAATGAQSAGICGRFADTAGLVADTSGLFAGASGLFAGRAWWRTVLADGMPPGTQACFVLASIGGRAAALFPLRRPDTGGTLDSLTTPYTCRYAPLLHPALDADATRRVFAAFGRFCRGAALTRLDALDAAWPALAACMQGARAAALVPLRFEHFGNWHESVGGLGWAGYLATRPGALRETIRRRLRRAARRTDATLTVHTAPDTVEDGIAAFEHVYARSWKEPEPYPRFNAGLMRATAAEGTLRLGIWRIAGTPVAAQLWILEGGTATVLKLAHDEAFKSESPGTILTALMLQRLLDQEGASEIDFGRGDDDYKQGWASRRRQFIGLVLANPRRPAGLAFLARHAAGRIRARLRAAAGPRG